MKISYDATTELETRLACLNSNWSVLFESQANRVDLTEAHARLVGKSESAPETKKWKYQQAAERFKTKIAEHDAYQKSLLEIKATHKEIIPDDSPKQSEDKTASQHLMNDVIPMNIEAVNSSKPNSHVRKGFLNKPWKRAVFIGLLFVAMAALAATGYGLLFEAPILATLVVALPAGVSFGIFGTLLGLLSGPYEKKVSDFSKSDVVVDTSETLQQQASQRYCATRTMLPHLPTPAMAVYPPNYLRENQSTHCFGRLFSCFKKNHQTQVEVTNLNSHIRNRK
jgi:hypothetical protein